MCDDDKIMLEHISDKLQEFYSECEINKYEDSESLLTDSSKLFFDVLFLDIDMPGLNGMGLAEKIRRDNKYVKIVFVTNMEEFVYAAYKYQVFRFVSSTGQIGMSVAKVDIERDWFNPGVFALSGDMYNVSTQKFSPAGSYSGFDKNRFSEMYECVFPAYLTICYCKRRYR